jgi:heme-degrading monooxygenase HmoA
MIASTPNTPYYAVLFTSILKADENYHTTAEQMVLLAQTMPGFLGFESARSEVGITVSYWQNEHSIKNWKEQTNHILAQQMGKEKFYKHYKVRVCLVQRDYEFNSEQ